MSKCRSCGAEIIWIKTAGGRNMPCNAQKVTYSETLPPGTLRGVTLVTERGTIVRTIFDPAGDKVGYVSHFATCPSAGTWRGRT